MTATSPCVVLGPTGDVQGLVKCYSLTSNKIIQLRTITPLPMPDRIIKQIKKLGKKSKQAQTAERLTFLNRHKEKSDWDNAELDKDDGLVDTVPHPTDDILAELPNVLQIPVQTELDMAAAAAANLNMPLMADEITGVNDHDNDAVVISGTESDDKQDDNNDDDNEDVEFVEEVAPHYNNDDAIYMDIPNEDNSNSNAILPDDQFEMGDMMTNLLLMMKTKTRLHHL